jgi:hypothetical protein
LRNLFGKYGRSASEESVKRGSLWVELVVAMGGELIDS